MSRYLPLIFVFLLALASFVALRKENQELRETIRSLAEQARQEEDLRVSKTEGSAIQAGSPDPPAEENERKRPEFTQYAKRRTAVLERLFELNEEERARLEDKFELELTKGEGSAESLDEIIGEERADFYREQRKRAFERAREESQEKEVLLLARQLGLDREGEDRIREAFAAVNAGMEEWRSVNPEEDPVAPEERSGRVERLSAMLAGLRHYRELKHSELQKVLSEDEYRAYVELEANSALAEMEIWH